MIQVSLGPKVPEAAVPGFANRIETSLAQKYGKSKEICSLSERAEKSRKSVAELCTKHFGSEECRKALLRYLGELNILQSSIGVDTSLQAPPPPARTDGVIVGAGTRPITPVLNVDPSTVWGMSLRPLSKLTTTSLRMERMCVLFNLAVIMSGPSPLRAAAILDDISRESAVVFHKECPPVDFDLKVLTFCRALLLALAHGGLTEKAEDEGKSIGLVMKLSAESRDLFDTAVKAFDAIPAGQLDGTWRSSCELSGLRFASLAQYCAAVSGEKAVRENLAGFGVLVARLQAAKSYIDQYSQKRKNAKIQLLGTKVDTLLSSLKKDNDFIYHEPIPDILEPLTRVNGLGVLPGREVVEALEEEASKICGEVAIHLIPKDIKDGWDRMRTILKSQGIEIGAFDADEAFQTKTLPNELLNLIVNLKNKGGMVKAHQQLNDALASSSNCDNAITTIRSSLETEAAEDLSLRTNFQVNRKVSADLTKKLWTELTDLSEKVKSARFANHTIQSKLSGMGGSPPPASSSSIAFLGMAPPPTLLSSSGSVAEVLSMEISGIEAWVRTPTNTAEGPSFQDLFDGLQKYRDMKEPADALIEETRLMTMVKRIHPADDKFRLLTMTANELIGILKNLEDGSTFFAAATACLSSLQEDVNKFVLARSADYRSLLQTVQTGTINRF